MQPLRPATSSSTYTVCDPVRPARLRRPGDRQPREALPRPRRARRRRAGAARRPGHGAPRDGADRRADRDRARDRAHARRVAEDAAPGGRRRGGRARRRRWSRCCTRSTTARAETEATLARQREFVADASHELRTPLTSVLANLELLEETLRRRPAATPRPPPCAPPSACAGSSPTCCCSPARTPGARSSHRPVDLSDVVAAAAAELEPVAGDHDISISAADRAPRSRACRTSCTGSC